MQTVQRRSLRSIMPTAGAVFENLFKQLDIQEPAFKNVVVLYRRKVPDKPQRKSEYEPIREHNVVSAIVSPHCSKFPITKGIAHNVKPHAAMTPRQMCWLPL